MQDLEFKSLKKEAANALLHLPPANGIQPERKERT